MRSCLAPLSGRKPFGGSGENWSVKLSRFNEVRGVQWSIEGECELEIGLFREKKLREEFFPSERVPRDQREFWRHRQIVSVFCVR